MLKLQGISPVQNQEREAPKFEDVWKEIRAKSQVGKEPKKREIKKTLGKDDFLRIMMTQMKNQDPMKPVDADKMATEMAQLTSVEQLKNMNSKLDVLTKANRPLERLTMTHLIGKTVDVEHNRFDYKKDSHESLVFRVPEDVQSVSLKIVSSSGETIVEEEIGAKQKGLHSFVWDGKKDNGIPADSGKYLFQISAINQNGLEIPIKTKSKSEVVGVEFSRDEPILIVQDSNGKQSKVMLRNVDTITDNKEVKEKPGAS